MAEPEAPELLPEQVSISETLSKVHNFFANSYFGPDEMEEATALDELVVAALSAALVSPAVPRNTDFKRLDQIEAMVMSLCEEDGKFPRVSMGKSGGIDYWREIMGKALDAACVSPAVTESKLPMERLRTEIAPHEGSDREGGRPSVSAPAVTAPVRVKELEWRLYPGDGTSLSEGQGERREYIEIAITPWAAVFLMQKGGRYSLSGLVTPQLGEFASIDEAKAAAQRDYETRIKSALVPIASAEPADRHKEIKRLIREEFDPTRARWNGKADWFDNAEDVATKIEALFPTGPKP